MHFFLLREGAWF